MTKIKKRLTLLIPTVVIILVVTSGYIFYSNSMTPKLHVQTTLPPSVTKAVDKEAQKTAEQKAEYTVPINHPRELVINKLGIDANVLSVGLLKDTSLDAPKTAWDVGWYDQSALPGLDEGALLLDGHVNDVLNQPGVFYRINTLKPGDKMTIERGDKQIFTYAVVEVDEKPTDQVDMEKMQQSITPGKQGLNLITCGGTYDYTRKTYDDRVLVYAQRIE